MNNFELGTVNIVRGFTGTGASTLAIQLAKKTCDHYNNRGSISIIDLECSNSISRVEKILGKIEHEYAVYSKFYTSISDIVDVIGEDEDTTAVLIFDSIHILNELCTMPIKQETVNKEIQRLREKIKGTNIIVVFVEHARTIISIPSSEIEREVYYKIDVDSVVNTKEFKDNLDRYTMIFNI